jgi:hypothetical protein
VGGARESDTRTKKRPTSRRREYAAVRLHDGQELIITVQLQVGHIGRRPAIDDQLVQNLELLALLHFVAHGPVAVHGAGEAHAEIHPHALVAHDAVQVVLVLLELEARQEAKTPKAEGQDGRHDTLKQP